MNASTCYGSVVNSRQAREFCTAGGGSPTPEMVLESEVIELRESEEVVDLTADSLEPAVINLTDHDAVVIIEERRRPRRNQRPLKGQSGICVVSSGKKGVMRDRDVYVTNSVYHNALEKETFRCTLPGCIQCRICMDGYLEIELTRQHIYASECGHIFCSRYLCTFLRNAKNCPVCLKKIDRHQYHRIYI